MVRYGFVPNTLGSSHIDHAADEQYMFGGLGEKIEDFLEKRH